MAVKKSPISSSTFGSSKPGNKKESQRLWTIIIGDVLVFLIFAIIGRDSHGKSDGLTAVGQIIWTTLPFALSWFLIAPFRGAFRRDVMTEPKKMAWTTLFAWLAAWPLGVILHFVFEWHVTSVVSTLTFALVTLITNTIFLLVWRIPFAITNEKRDHQEQVSAKQSKR
jgi:uncharacterized integral membrane protein